MFGRGWTKDDRFLIRLLIIFGLGYLAYRVVRSWMATQFLDKQQTKNQKPQPIEDIMIKDPYCGAYFPQRQGETLRYDGQDLFFCSKECRDKFIKEKQA
jgi:uncharacterized protein